jgi:SAM-dependent methyltransferase
MEGMVWPMQNYDPAFSFRAEVARDYDAVSQRGDETETVECLAQLASGGPVLELAIGTGRIALPLAARGIRVDGIDISEAMIAQLRAKPGGNRLQVTVGNFADVQVEGEYRLIYLIFNTITNLLTQDEQVRCFENVAKHLTAGGCFLIETMVPSVYHRLRGDQHVDAEHVGPDCVRLDVLRHDPVQQRLEESHVTLAASGITLNPIVTRYVWPSELDLMARLGGLALQHRWAGWQRQPFTADSRRHVSVYA